jgi:hypothetical protein
LRWWLSLLLLVSHDARGRWSLELVSSLQAFLLGIAAGQLLAPLCLLIGYVAYSVIKRDKESEL